MPEEQRRHLVEVGYEQGARLTRLIEQLLDLSRLDATAVALKPRLLVLRSVLAETLSNSTLDPDTVRLEGPSDLAIVADPLVLDRVITSLLATLSATEARLSSSPPSSATGTCGSRLRTPAPASRMSSGRGYSSASVAATTCMAAASGPPSRAPMRGLTR
jgi:two-component system sensor histidine kinase KdpD